MLSDDTLWGLYSDHKDEDWFNDLASIMQLHTSENKARCTKLIHPLSFTTGDMSVAPATTIATTYKFQKIRYFTNPDKSCWAYEIEPASSRNERYLNMKSFLYPVYEHCISNGGFPLHAALIEKNGYGVVLSGRSGVGKSTCTKRVRHLWHSRCDDMTLLVNKKDQIFAHPLPTWSDYIWRRAKNSWNVQKHSNVKGIFFLEQSSTDGIIDISQRDASFLLIDLASQMCRPYWFHMERIEVMKQKSKIFCNAWEIARNVPCYVLNVSPNGEFWKEIEKVI